MRYADDGHRSLGAKASRERDLILAMIAARIVSPNTTLAQDFGVSDADENDV